MCGTESKDDVHNPEAFASKIRAINSKTFRRIKRTPVIWATAGGVLPSYRRPFPGNDSTWSATFLTLMAMDEEPT